MASGIPLLVAALLAHSGDGSPPPYELHPSVDAAAISPNTALGTQWVKALGEAGDVGACSALCSGWRNATDPAAACLSFTLYNSSAPPALQGRCYGRVTPLWIPHRSTSATSGRLLIPCRSNLDCSLNGACGSDGRCNCSAGWKGLRCGELNLGPVNPRALGFKDPIRSSWGAGFAEVQPAGGGKPVYHGYVCVLSNRCGIMSWFANSEVVHAVSDSPFGPFTVSSGQDSVGSRPSGAGAPPLFPPFSTNPTYAEGPEGELVLVMGMSSPNGSAADPALQCNCTDGSTPHSCRPARPKFYTTMAVAPKGSPSGPWRVFDILGSRGWGYNFALTIRANGSALGVTRIGFVSTKPGGRYDDPAGWNNPTSDSIPFSSEPLAAGEDPFVFTDPEGNYHCLFHAFDHQGGLGATYFPGSHAYSEDGKVWHYSGAAYSNIVEYSDGTQGVLTRRERPHLVFSTDSGVRRIVALSNGVIEEGDEGANGDRSWTLVQPIVQP